MKILITGICGFVGSRIAVNLQQRGIADGIFGIDNLSRRGAETSLALLKREGIKVFHGDLRLKSDVEVLPAADWVIDCAANPSVIAGISPDSGCSAAQLVEHNLSGTLNLLEYCRRHTAGLILLSSSRVYAVEALNRIPLKETATRFVPDTGAASTVPGFSSRGISEAFSTTPPVSLYGATKLSSEIMALEYGNAFNFPVWVNRCGVIAGNGQFGKIDQGIISFWVYSLAMGKPLKYIGFGGTGKQVRDCMVPEDVADLCVKQMNSPEKAGPRIFNIGGGEAGALSLLELTELCQSFFKEHYSITADTCQRAYDIPYYVTDTSLAQSTWQWQASKSADKIVLELCRWASENKELIRTFY